MQILTYADGKIGLALIPDRLRKMLAGDAALLSTQATLAVDYRPSADAAGVGNIDTDRLSVFTLPDHGNRAEYLVRFQRGLLAWSVLTSGIENFIEFDRRFIQPFVLSMRSANGAGPARPPTSGFLS